MEAEHGVWHCHLAGACSDACPKGVDPALAIQLLKRRLVGRTLKLAKVKIPAKIVPQIDFIEYNKEI
jgi:succinate dehydrogenase / fumarate reductase iron-sulfur subunit